GSLTPSVTLPVDTTANPIAHGGSASTRLLPPNSSRIEANNTALTVLGQTLTANFVFEQVTGQLSPQAQNNPGATPPKFVRFAASNVDLLIGTAAAGVQLQSGEGFFVVTPAGVAGRLSGTITFQIPGNAVSLDGTFTVAINTTVV